MSKTTRAATIEDVATRAGVSVATVSRALQKPDIVSKKTRARVEAAVAELGYTANVMARRLRTKQSRMIVVLVPDIGNPFFSEILSGIEAVATKNGYDILIGNTDNDPRRERRFADYMRSYQADGLLLLNGRMPSDLLATGTPPPMVALCERIPGVSLPTVGVDNQGAAAVATRHLIQLGHRRIAHIAGPADNVLTTERLTGFRRALAEADLSADEKLIVTGDFSAASGSSAVEHMLALGAAPSAIFCANDEMAMGAAVALKANGYVVPSDVSLVGFDDINLAKYYDPPLTTIHQPRRRIGESGMRLLFDLLAGEEIPVEEMNLPTELIVRGSTAPVAG